MRIFILSPAESSAGEDVSNSSSSWKRSRVRRTNKATVVDGGWTDNNAQDAADPLPFTGDSGCVEPVQSEDPLDFFEQFVTSDFVSDCVRETNRYASDRRNEANPSPFSRMRSWVETTVYELFLYFTVLILMGVDRRPKLSMYWSQDFLLNTPAFSTLMSRDRFLLIRRFLHFVNNSDYERGVSGKLFKIKPVLEYFQKNSSLCLTLESFLQLMRAYCYGRADLVGNSTYLKNDPDLGSSLLSCVIVQQAICGILSFTRAEKPILMLIMFIAKAQKS